jgi:hypothetical protein
MSTTGNKTTIQGLDLTLAQIKEAAEQLHQSALRDYPKPIYQSFDSRSVELRQQYSQLSKVKIQKNIELGIVSLDIEIDYLQQRSKELEDFYCIAVQEDSEAIRNSINGIQEAILNLKKERYQLIKKEFDLS